MTTAYTIQYFGPTNTKGARLAFANPMGKTRYVSRDYAVSAEKQAQNLAEATPGFKMFCPAHGKPDIWVYFAEANHAN